MKTIIVTVTEEDIKTGMRRNTTFCPVGKALQRIGFHSIIVYRKHVLINPNKRDELDIPLSARAIRFIARFDRNEYVQPFTFKLKIPEN